MCIDGVKRRHSIPSVSRIHIGFLLCHVQDKWTPLMIASQNGHVDVVNVLLQHGASVHLQNKVRL